VIFKKMPQEIRIGFYPEDYGRKENEDPQLAGTPLIYPGDGHLILVAPTRSGKGADVLTPIALTYRGSMIIIDPKAQLAAITKRQRSQFGKVLVLNPFNILAQALGNQGGPSGTPARFNPMDMLDPESDAFEADCDTLAQGIVKEESGDNAHFSDSARQLVSAAIMHLKTYYPPPQQNLAFMRAKVTKDIFDFAASAMNTGTEAVKERLARFADPKAPESREIGSIISTANTQTAFLSIKAIARSVSGSDFQFRDLRQGPKPVTVYLSLPTRYLSATNKWFRLVVASALNALLQEPEPGEDTPVLAILDEFYQLGKMEILRDAMSLAAGYGLQLFPVLQDITQLQEHYGKEGYNTFLANSAAQLYFAPHENVTAKHLSDLSGEKEVVFPAHSQREAKEGETGISVSWSRQVVPEQRPHDALRLPPDKFFLFRRGELVIRDRRPYYCKTAGQHRRDNSCSEFHGMYDPDPYYRPGR
jgi:type IV secretion system protein VirD4